MTDHRMPAAFVGHGNPMNTLLSNRYTEAWSGFAASHPRPRAILSISAHWFINATAVTSMAQPDTIHDFFGFPDELFAFRYPAPGSPELCEEIIDTVAPTWVGRDVDSWGIDHGTWEVLAHMYPAADIPVVQMSVKAFVPDEYHVALGRQLAPLRDRGVLILCSGNVVHNLGADYLRFDEPDMGYDWAQSFDDEARRLMTEAPEDITSLRSHPAYDRAVPTPDHFLPLLYLAGLAQASNETCEVMVGGHAYGSLSMTSYSLA